MRCDEFDDLPHERIGREHLLHVLEPLHQRALACEQHAIGLAQLVDVLAGKAVALEADNVQPRQIGAVAEHHAEGNDVLLDPGHAADKTVGADAHELMHGAEAAEDGVVADGDMARERGVVDEDDVVADLAVVGDMGADHQQAVRADARDKTAALGAGIDRDMLADDGMRPISRLLCSP